MHFFKQILVTSAQTRSFKLNILVFSAHVHVCMKNNFFTIHSPQHWNPSDIYIATEILFDVFFFFTKTFNLFTFIHIHFCKINEKMII